MELDRTNITMDPHTQEIKQYTLRKQRTDRKGMLLNCYSYAPTPIQIMKTEPSESSKTAHHKMQTFTIAATRIPG
jgi:hypothetical protein